MPIIDVSPVNLRNQRAAAAVFLNNGGYMAPIPGVAPDEFALALDGLQGKNYTVVMANQPSATIAWPPQLVPTGQMLVIDSKAVGADVYDALSKDQIGDILTANAKSLNLNDDKKFDLNGDGNVDGDEAKAVVASYDLKKTADGNYVGDGAITKEEVSAPFNRDAAMAFYSARKAGGAAAAQAATPVVPASTAKPITGSNLKATVGADGKPTSTVAAMLSDPTNIGAKLDGAKLTAALAEAGALAPETAKLLLEKPDTDLTNLTVDVPANGTTPAQKIPLIPDMLVKAGLVDPTDKDPAKKLVADSVKAEIQKHVDAKTPILMSDIAASLMVPVNTIYADLTKGQVNVRAPGDAEKMFAVGMITDGRTAAATTSSNAATQQQTLPPLSPQQQAALQQLTPQQQQAFQQMTAQQQFAFLQQLATQPQQPATLASTLLPLAGSLLPVLFSKLFGSGTAQNQQVSGAGFVPQNTASGNVPYINGVPYVASNQATGSMPYINGVPYAVASQFPYGNYPPVSAQLRPYTTPMFNPNIRLA